MRTTRKKVIKTVYKDEDQSDAEEMQDFSDSGSEAQITEGSESEDEVISEVSSSSEFTKKTTRKAVPKKPTSRKKTLAVTKPKFAETFVNKIRQKPLSSEDESGECVKKFSVKNMTAADKLLPPILNLSDSDSSDGEGPSPSKKVESVVTSISQNDESESDKEVEHQYEDIWSKHLQPDNSEEIAKKTFMELEKHKLKIEEAKASFEQFSENNDCRKDSSMDVDVNDLLAQGEEKLPTPAVSKRKTKKKKDHFNSDSEIEDWEEVNEKKALPTQGLQLFVEFPDGSYKKSKKIDVEMMMRRKINRVKKEYQVYMHQVHVLAWIGHGNYVSQVLNDQEVMAAALSIVPSKSCYPGERVDMKFVEQITTWFKGKLSLKQDKHEDKYKPKAPPLKEILLSQIKSKVVTSKKYLVFIFISILRAMGLQCRVIFNFVTLPIKPPQSELCSLSTKNSEKKADDDKTTIKKEDIKTEKSSKCHKKTKSCKTKSKPITQLDGVCDSSTDDDEYKNIMQLDGNDDSNVKTRRSKTAKAKVNLDLVKRVDEDVSPPKRTRVTSELQKKEPEKIPEKRRRATKKVTVDKTSELNVNPKDDTIMSPIASPIPRKTRSNVKENNYSKLKDTKEKKESTRAEDSEKSDLKIKQTKTKLETKSKKEIIKKDAAIKIVNAANPKIVVTDSEGKEKVSKYFDKDNKSAEPRKRISLSRKRSQTAASIELDIEPEQNIKDDNVKKRTKSAPGTSVETSKYFNNTNPAPTCVQKRTRTKITKQDLLEDQQRVSHRDLIAKSKPKNDIKGDLIDIIKKRVNEAKTESKRGIVKGKAKPDSGEDSDYLAEEDAPKHLSDSDDDFKPTKISPGPSKSLVKKKIDRRVVSPDDEKPKNKVDVWCEVFVEELEQWVSVDVVRARVHCTQEIYSNATHPVCYVLGWDNNKHVKDVTRRYVPAAQWLTATRRLRAAPGWLARALAPGRGPRGARDREEDDQLDRAQQDAPLPKTISEYKNHPLYALRRHLLKFEALYPAAAPPLGFVRGEPVFARACVFTCQSRDRWLRDAKVVKLGEAPYKIVKARPKWDKLSNKCITDQPLEIFGPWQVQDYEPPAAEGGLVPRNAYGNVELFKESMLPKGTVHIKLPGLNRVAKKLDIDCAPAMTGFDYSGGCAHPVYDGFVVCAEFHNIVIEAWEQDQEDQERKENEKLEARVYGNWKRLIKGLLIRERLKLKYGLELAGAKETKKKLTGPRLVVKKGA